MNSKEYKKQLNILFISMLFNALLIGIIGFGIGYQTAYDTEATKELKEIKDFQVILANYNTDRVLCDYDRISDKFNWYYEAGINATLKTIEMPTYDGSQIS